MGIRLVQEAQRLPLVSAPLGIADTQRSSRDHGGDVARRWHRVEVGASLTSDEGWYLFKLNLLDDRYQKAFAAKLTAVQAAVS